MRVDDADTPVAALKARVAAFTAARDWEQYHSPKNLAMSIAIAVARRTASPTAA